MKIYDTKQKQKVDFIPIVAGQARIYVCGPTVYDNAHLGHARSSIAFDLLVRTLELLGYAVEFVKNFTDIDDKIIKKAIEKKMDIVALSSHYIELYLQDMQALGVKRPSKEPKASESLGAMVEMITTLLQKGIAYQTSNGDIYLDVSKDGLYGSISHRGTHEDSNISRVGENDEKRNEKDFALWKSYKGDEDIGYETPLGKGRPGWHIECSAMIASDLAYTNEPYQIDIHGGGADLTFPHHENEASQTRCATGVEIAKYWMHNGFVNINGEKMSKSLGNSFFIKDALRVYDGEILRNYLLGTHYRAILHFNEEDLAVSKKRLDKLYRLKKRVQDVSVAGFEGGQSGDDAFRLAILEAMSDDLNVSKALSVLEEMMATCNEKLDSSPKDKALKAKVLANIDFVTALLGIGGKDALDYFQLGVSEEQKTHIKTAIAQRTQAKQNKDFALADKIRDELAKEGIMLMDTPQGCVWEKMG
ncbi:cysteine--tRNA ligase [Helicobacter sp. 11S02596-1]|uniref:cysteine--tRNA ligase n=1 Tax=Helicobacter sp. 11S02596-1 TaxID=1476194 RepID=UPI000BA69631|nr:cysteine--tRNA ligase [Helicobacter sp. 11S02596-1]PAF43242.1 cysteine--tRNA ligase [Helicobacter sp. 11S02596-1]